MTVPRKTIDRNKPIYGFEDEYTGTVGHEKAVHHTHFHVPNKFRDTEDADGDYEWVMIRPGRWKRIKKKEIV